MIKLSTLSAFALAIAPAVAQQFVLPSQGAAADTSFSVNIFRNDQSHLQAIYDSSIFTGQGQFSPVQINSVEWRQAAGTLGANLTYDMEVYVGYAAVDYAAVVTGPFANQRVVPWPTTPNFAGLVTRTVATGATPVNDYVVNVALTTPFIYDPSLGQDLLIEFRMPTVPTGTTGTNEIVSSNSVATHKCSVLRAFGATSYAIANGTLSVFCPLVRLGCSVPPGVAKHDPYGNGCYDIPLSFYEHFPGTYPASSNDLSNTTLNGVMNVNGGYTVFSTPGATVVAPTTTGLALADDAISAGITLPFTFDYPGGSTSTIFVDSNGSIALNGTPAPASINNSTAAVTLLNSANHRLCASLQDLLPDGTTNIANVFAEVDPNNPNIFLITWLNVPCFVDTAVHTPSGLTSTFQIALIDGGATDSFEFRYQTLVNDSDSYSGAAITGFSRGGGALDGGSLDLSTTVVNTSTELPGLKLFGSPRPILGNPVSYSLSNVRPNAGICSMMASFNQLPGGVPMTTYGFNAPGCNLYIDPLSSVGFGPLLLGAPTSSFTHTWPTGPWTGVLLYVQGFELAPGQNGLGVLSSNGMKVELGIN